MLSPSVSIHPASAKSCFALSRSNGMSFKVSLYVFLSGEIREACLLALPCIITSMISSTGIMYAIALLTF